MDRKFFSGKRVLVMGLGRFGGGLDSVRYAAEHAEEVIVTDLASKADLAESLQSLSPYKNIRYHLGGHDEADFGRNGADLFIINPAVPADNFYVRSAEQAGKFITSQLEIFFELCPARIIGITGSNGKSTTTTLIHHLLQAGIGQPDIGYNQVWLGGNIGNKPLLDIVDQIDSNDLVVLELSSFQLEQLARIHKAPHAAVITNLTPNHLDRHGTFEIYCRAKENIFIHQKLDPNHPALSVFNAEDPITLSWFERYRHQLGRTCKTFRPADIPNKIAEKLVLAGPANLSNLSAALVVATFFGVSKDRIRKAVASYRGLPHRLELVAIRKNVGWYDDSKATTPISSIAALRAFTCPEIIIAGGYDKHIPFDEFGKVIAEKAKAAILLGQTADKIAMAIEAHKTAESSIMVHKAGTLPEAVQTADQLSTSGDVVLLSTACASYDMFRNYEHRAQVFRDAIAELKS
jgi:UDP-N-acetylmuramoylalanine--D-glutamate ligase